MNRSNMNAVTDKQRSLIQKMEQLLDVTFTGTTKQEASAFITRYMEEYKEQQAFVFDMVHNENHY
ncbi:hypothetical protein ACFYKX_11290 [Cytobacillus sp. FJAT-54145]|uniref:Uncharacterized protein n=1 Tax=Cytobacillus spartinae TaxID=3299023 RepID=A0ABW6KAI3_9BACI